MIVSDYDYAVQMTFWAYVEWYLYLCGAVVAAIILWGMFFKKGDRRDWY